MWRHRYRYERKEEVKSASFEESFKSLKTLSSCATICHPFPEYTNYCFTKYTITKLFASASYYIIWNTHEMIWKKLSSFLFFVRPLSSLPFSKKSNDLKFSKWDKVTHDISQKVQTRDNALWNEERKNWLFENRRNGIVVTFLRLKIVIIFTKFVLFSFLSNACSFIDKKLQV